MTTLNPWHRMQQSQGSLEVRRPPTSDQPTGSPSCLRHTVQRRCRSTVVPKPCPSANRLSAFGLPLGRAGREVSIPCSAGRNVRVTLRPKEKADRREALQEESRRIAQERQRLSDAEAVRKKLGNLLPEGNAQGGSGAELCCCPVLDYGLSLLKWFALILRPFFG